ncbi:MAG: hypothetical protein IJT66_04380 [Clostridia bacterium]|nr:hypothetical protein [Clostridia bacterium]
MADCDKGLVEGFVPPLETHFGFDHSHAWGGTPLYSLPMALLGLRIKKAGFKEISLSPSLLDFSFAKVEIPTPYGDIIVELNKGDKPKIHLPDGIIISE